jgi:hypothetical protein
MAMVITTATVDPLLRPPNPIWVIHICNKQIRKYIYILLFYCNKVLTKIYSYRDGRQPPVLATTPAPGYGPPPGATPLIGGGPPPPAGAPQQGAVMMVYGLDHEKMNCERIFNLFCLFGNVVRVSSHPNGVQKPMIFTQYYP